MNVLVMAVIASILSDGKIDEDKLDKVIYYFIWIILALFAWIIFGYCFQNVFLGILFVTFVIVIGLCIIFWKKDNEKNIEENEYKQTY